MSQFGIHGRLYDSIKSVYAQSSACVRLNGAMTGWFSVSSGVKQGDVLSPTLFNMFMNDLVGEIKDLNCGLMVEDMNVCIFLYADDIVLVAPDEHSLQMQLNKLAEWCNKWRMVVNENITQIIHFRPQRTKLTDFAFTYNNSVLEIVREYKYLGIILDEFMSFKCTSNALSKAAGRALGLLRYKLRSLKECRSSTFTKLFSSHICPIMDYCAGVWGIKEFDCIEQVQLKALRYFLGVHRFAASDMLRGDAGWVKCSTRHKIAIIRLWNRLVTLDPDRITFKIFLWDLNFHAQRGSWTHGVHEIFKEINTENCFENITPCDPEHVYSKLLENETTKWNTSRYSKTKLRLYNMFKADFSQEDYFSLDVPKYHRSLFSQLRAGILPLQIEVGRYRNIPLGERLCTLCNNGEVEDELHFVCSCSMYSEFRETLYDHGRMYFPDFDNLDVTTKFVVLMSNCQKQMIAFTAKACHKRRSAIYQ